MKTVVITGANRGIGLELVKQFLSQGCEVYGLCRNSSDELNDSGAKVVTKVDMSNPDSLQEALGALKDVKIDILINNAGVLAQETLDEWSPNTIDYQFKVNALAPLLVTQILQGQLNSGAKVAMITSRMGSMTDNGSGGYYGYRMSKAALNAAGVSLARDLKNKDIAVALLHPGYVQTEMVNYGGDVSAQESASRLVQRIEELNSSNSGSFWHANGETLPW